MKKILLVYFTLFSLSLFSQKIANFSELGYLQKKEPRKVLIFLHTDWCGYCRLMESKIFRDKEISNILDEKFYFISFNPEISQQISFKGKEYYFKKNGIGNGIQELALHFSSTSKSPIYPSLIFLDKNLDVLWIQEGFLNKKRTKTLLETLIKAES